MGGVALVGQQLPGQPDPRLSGRPVPEDGKRQHRLANAAQLLGAVLEEHRPPQDVTVGIGEQHRGRA
ncbi:hypothetical protein [Amycolatopsis sp. NPDC051128]|uniref:hypothetical protein n=1 Tax=Amycolatopsis sp. NPDC051128 TaxID=3155412 RepID=UPI00343F05EE